MIQQDQPCDSNVALERCDDQIAWYTSARKRLRCFHYSSQVCIVVLTASVPLLALLARDPLIENSQCLVGSLIRSPAIHASLSGVAAMIVALASVFQWHKKWMARAYTCELLKSERVKFLTRSGELYRQKSDTEAVQTFVLRVEEIALQELEEWKRVQRDSGHK